MTETPIRMRRNALEPRVDEPGMFRSDEQATPDAFIGAFARWTTGPEPVGALVQLARRYALRARTQRGSPLGKAFAAARKDRAGRAVKLAIAAMDLEPDACAREAVRAVLASAVSERHALAAQSLFGPAAGWDPARPEARASAILFVKLSKSTRAWHSDLLRLCGSQAEKWLRVAALRGRVTVASLIGLSSEGLSDLVADIVGEPGLEPGAAFKLTNLLWSSQALEHAATLLERYPSLRTTAETQPPLARLWVLAAEHGAFRRPPDAVHAAARIAADIERASGALWSRLGSTDVKVAVVGNSPCEIGRGRGAEIDRHDVIVRFNRAPEGAGFEGDYGRRCDVKMINRSVFGECVSETGAPVVLVRQSKIFGPEPDLFEIAAAHRKTLAFLPDTAKNPLAAQLSRVPTSGILVLGVLRELRGSLTNVSCYGFSFIDQLSGVDPTHYFEAGARLWNHDWRAERALFDAWMAGRELNGRELAELEEESVRAEGRPDRGPAPARQGTGAGGG